MKTQIHTQTKLNFTVTLTGIFFALAAFAQAADPRTNSWFTTYSSQYARIYTNNAMKTAGTALTTWSNGSAQTQSTPAYCGVQEVYSSSNSVYIRSTGLAGYTMGPWQNGTFPNLPANQKILYRVPRTNNVTTTKTITGGGQIGIFVDGVEMFNSWDAFAWNGSAEVSAGNTTYYWNRDAYVNEGATFDAGNAHQQNTGTYHYHANPPALRYLLGDHVDYNSSTKTFPNPLTRRRNIRRFSVGSRMAFRSTALMVIPFPTTPVAASAGWFPGMSFATVVTARAILPRMDARRFRNGRCGCSTLHQTSPLAPPSARVIRSVVTWRIMIFLATMVMHPARILTTSMNIMVAGA